MLKLVIGNKNYSSWSLRAWLFLRESGIPFEEIHISLYGDPDWRSELARYTPAGRVPVLVDGNVSVWDSLAIFEYARERHPELKFTASRVQDYEPPADAFDLVVSMACISCACRAEEIPAVADGLVRSLRPGGRLLLVDAFHTLPILVRTSRISSRGVIWGGRGGGLSRSSEFSPERLTRSSRWSCRRMLL